MKASLEDERRKLLEQIEASRAVYRRMLSGEPVSTASRTLPHGGLAPRQGYGVRRSERVLHWMTEHPLWVAGAVALLVLLAPRVVNARRRAARVAVSHLHRDPDHPRRGGSLRALLTTTAVLLRHPAQLRAAERIAQSAWRWLQRRRGIASAIPATGIRTDRFH